MCVIGGGAARSERIGVMRGIVGWIQGTDRSGNARIENGECEVGAAGPLLDDRRLRGIPRRRHASCADGLRLRGFECRIPAPLPAGNTTSGGYSSGQRGQTVNLLTYVYGGSNPSPPTDSTCTRLQGLARTRATSLRFWS